MTPKRTHAAFGKYCDSVWIRADGAMPTKCWKAGQERCGICGIKWLTRRLKRYARNHGRRDHVMYLMGAINEAMKGKERK